MRTSFKNLCCSLTIKDFGANYSNRQKTNLLLVLELDSFQKVVGFVIDQNVCSWSIETEKLSKEAWNDIIRFSKKFLGNYKISVRI